MRVYTDEEFAAALRAERARVIGAVLDEIDAFSKTRQSVLFYQRLHDRVAGLSDGLEPPSPSPVVNRAADWKPEAGPSTT